jgi:hypothetical protein
MLFVLSACQGILTLFSMYFRVMPLSMSGPSSQHKALGSARLGTGYVVPYFLYSIWAISRKELQ